MKRNVPGLSLFLAVLVMFGLGLGLIKLFWKIAFPNTPVTFYSYLFVCGGIIGLGLLLFLFSRIFVVASTETLVDAIKDGAAGRAEKIIAKGVNIDAPNKLGETPLETAIDWRRQEIAARLIDLGADLGPVFNERTRILEQVYDSGRVEALRPLLARAFGKVPTERILAIASYGNDSITVKRCLKENGLRLEMGLLKAASKAHIDIIRLLLQAGADVNAVDPQGNTALILAASGDAPAAPDAVRLLCENQAAVNIRNTDGQTALSRARNEEVRSLLKAAGALTTQQTNRLDRPKEIEAMLESLSVSGYDNPFFWGWETEYGHYYPDKKPIPGQSLVGLVLEFEKKNRKEGLKNSSIKGTSDLVFEGNRRRPDGTVEHVVLNILRVGDDGYCYYERKD